MRDPNTQPLIRVELKLADGSTLEREWTMRTLVGKDASLKAALEAPPAWLESPRRSWDHPQDPITYRGSVRSGSEDEARAFVEALP
jgi:hypothetical protein